METSPNLRMTFLVRLILSHPSIQATLHVESTLKDEFRNVRVDCIDTSTPRLFVKFYLGVCGNKAKKGGGDCLSISVYTITMRPL